MLERNRTNSNAISESENANTVVELHTNDASDQDKKRSKTSPTSPYITRDKCKMHQVQTIIVVLPHV